MKDGTFFSGSFLGRWKREGTKVIARYIDLVSNGDMTLYIVHFDATEDEMTIEQHSFTQSNLVLRLFSLAKITQLATAFFKSSF